MKRLSLALTVSLFLLVAACTLVISGSNHAKADPGGEGHQFEYFFLDPGTISYGPDPTVTASYHKAAFDALGHDGWEFIGITKNNDFYIFKRRTN